MLLIRVSLVLLLLGDQRDSIANSVRGTTVSGPGVSNEEKNSSLGRFLQATHLTRIIIALRAVAAFIISSKMKATIALTNYSSSCKLKRLRKRSTRPAVSRIRCCPLKNGWHFEQTSIFSKGLMLSVWKLLPQAQL